MKIVYEWLADIRYSAQDYFNDNELVHPYQLDDGQLIFEFVRYINPWGKYSVSHQEYIAHQLGPNQVGRLIENQGYLIFYTHLGTSCCPPYLSDSTVAALRHIKARVASGDLLVATTTRLLDYYVQSRSVHWHVEPRGDAIRIVIDSLVNVVERSYQPEPDALMGLTFYIPDDRAVELLVQGEPMDVVFNPPDHTGRRSISIPWVPLEYPRITIRDGDDNHR